MPMYDHECEDCGTVTEAFKQFEDRTISCPKCEGKAHRIVSFGKKARTVDVFNEYAEEHLGDDEPIVRSREHLAQLCRERGVASRRLMEGYRNFGPKREI